MINAITFNLSLLVKCKRNCKWCYLQKERKNAKYAPILPSSNVRENVLELAKKVKIAVGNSESDTNVLYLSLPCISFGRTGKSISNLLLLINSFIMDLVNEKVILDQIYILGQPKVVSYMRTCSTFASIDQLITGVIACISHKNDIDNIKDICLTDYDRLTITEVNDKGDKWSYKELRTLAETIRSRLEGKSFTISEILVESIFNRKNKTFDEAENVAYILESMGVTAIVSQCTDCGKPGVKCMLETSQIRSIETVNDGINIGCPYKIRSRSK